MTIHRGVGEVWEVLCIGLCRYVYECGMNAPHGGRKVGAAHLSCSVVSVLYSAPALVERDVPQRRSRRIRGAAVEVSAACLGASKDSS